ncbi:MAG: inorganic phosphate transporter [Gemmataceae bacterium]
MASTWVLLVLVVLLALVFDYINGFHDTANAVATVVSTNVLPGRTAVLLAAVFNVVGALLTGSGVAATIGTGIVANPEAEITQTVVIAALLGAIVWNLLTWYFGIPSSSSHALIGGIVGAVWSHQLTEGAAAGEALMALIGSRGVTLALKALVLSPLLGLAGGFVLMILLLWLVVRMRPLAVNYHFRHLQLVSAGFMAFAHGSNDAQKSMGIIFMALLTHGVAAPGDPLPYWVVLSCAAAMGLGTASGGWRIMKTMGHKIIKLRPINGFAAESAAAAVILAATALHAPVSTTHVISASIMGVGASKRASAVRWGVARNILMAWLLTIPVAALVSAGSYLVLRAFLGG